MEIRSNIENANSGKSPDWLEPMMGWLDRVSGLWAPEDAGRRALLESAAAEIYKLSESLADGEALPMTFICTHNSRRSHLSQVMATVAAEFYRGDGGIAIQAFSGGTEATACNPRTVAAFRRAGFSVVNMSGGDNPVYLLQYAESAEPMNLFSKIYDRAGNPEEDYVAVMTCNHADENCPIVRGASSRISLPFVDPKISDDTPEEAQTYDQRLIEIGREMFFLFRRIAEKSAVNDHQ